MTRRAITGWFLVHKWSSLVCTAFLLMLCVTGLPLIFHDEIDTALAPARPLPPVPAGTRPLDLDRLLAAALADGPGHVPLYISFDTDRPVVNFTTGPTADAPAELMRFQSLDARTGRALVVFVLLIGVVGLIFARMPNSFLPNEDQGYIIANIQLPPGATAERTDRESAKGRIGGRTHEIQRLIGRSLRGVVDLGRLGERTITVDCDVLQADGGTRTASITGGYVALGAALITYGMERLLVGKVAAVSVGIIDGTPRLDLPYEEDVRAETDMNVVMDGAGRFIEVQGTAEGAPFDRAELDALLDLATGGCADLTRIQAEALGS